MTSATSTDTQLGWRWIYLAAALPFLGLSLVSWEYGSLLFYLAPVALCAVQLFYPTRGVWALLLVFYSGAATALLILAAADGFLLLSGQSPATLVDASDAVAFLVATAVLSALAVALLRAKPTRH